MQFKLTRVSWNRFILDILLNSKIFTILKIFIIFMFSDLELVVLVLTRSVVIADLVLVLLVDLQIEQNPLFSNC